MKKMTALAAVTKSMLVVGDGCVVVGVAAASPLLVSKL